VLLGEIAQISTGLNYKKSDFTLDQPNIPLIQVKDIQNNNLIKNNVFRIKKECIDKHLLLIPRDILFAAKGNRNYAFQYKGELGIATASSTFFILRLRRNDILPEYLTWYLNSKPAQDFFNDNVHGTFIPSISKSKLSELEVPIPPVEIQEKVIRLDGWQKLEKNLTEQILFKKSILANEIINRTINIDNE